MANHPLPPDVAKQTLEALEAHGTSADAARALGISRTTFQHRLQRARQFLDANTNLTLLQEQRFAEFHINHGSVVVCSDVHCWPGDLTTAQRAFIWFVQNIKPKMVVINGDLFDGSSLSRFPSSNWNTKPTIRQELDACVRFTTAVESVAGNAKLMFVPGNHDERFNRKLASEVSEFAGISGFNLFDYFPRWEVCYRLTVNPEGNGATDIVHNWAGGIHAAYNNVLRSGVSYVTGHTHRNLVRPWSDRTGTRWGVESGTLAGADHPSAYYVGGRPTDWHPGFVVLTYHDGMLLRPEQVDVVGGTHVSYRGVVAEPPEF